jgi:malate dehydrogenase (oxaloacetate-decarboxylating)
MGRKKKEFNVNQPSSPNGPVETALTGFNLVNNAVLNKGTAFTNEERDVFHLHGLLPPHVGTLNEQISRRLKILRAFSTGFERYAFLRNLQDTNETLFYALLTRNLEETLPLVYTPTVGEGCQHFSEIWHKPRGLFLSFPNKHRIREIFSDKRFDRVRVIVVSDGERILGLGDQGAGGMGIPIGKLSLYTACAGIHPEETLPILLDVGTNNAERLADPLYVGWRHERVRGDEYDAFIEEFVSAVTARWPSVLLQWEDFAGANAARLLHRYRDRLLTFNDDIQGTAAAAFGTLLAAINVTGVPLTEQRVVILGAGAAGIGIASLLRRAMLDAGLSEAEARRRLYAVGRHGLLVEDTPVVTAAQAPFAQTRRNIADWVLQEANGIDLLDVVSNAKPTVLIGVSGQGGAFTEPVVREMAKHVDRPVIFPLSNPTSLSEATPEQVASWTNGRALVGTGSPFGSVRFEGRSLIVNQTNNSYIFPGIGLGVIAAGARRITDGMFMIAGRALADLSPAKTGEDDRLLPPVDQLRAVAVAVAFAVARQAQTEGVADHCSDHELRARIGAHIWEPDYRSYRELV